MELTGTTQVRLLDGELRGDLGRYLQTLAGNHADGLRHLTLMDRGGGARELRVSYISEVPVWKCTYRILFDGAAKAGSAKTATLQGWGRDRQHGGDGLGWCAAVVVAGAPQSFLQPISQPVLLATARDRVAAGEAQLTPQTHESGVEAASSGVAGAAWDLRRHGERHYGRAWSKHPHPTWPSRVPISHLAGHWQERSGGMEPAGWAADQGMDGRGSRNRWWHVCARSAGTYCV